MSNIDKDELELINFSLRAIEDLVIKFGEYFPIATAISIDGETIPIHYFDGDEHPLSEDLIKQFVEILDKRINDSEIRSYAIAYDVIAQKNSESKKTDAIAIKIIHNESVESMTYFFAYELTREGKFEIGESWAKLL
jgi:hypothetical protein